MRKGKIESRMDTGDNTEKEQNQESKEIEAAALILCSLKHTKINQYEALVLERLKKNFCKRNRGINHNPISREQPRTSHSQDLPHQAKGKLVTILREQSRISHSQDLPHQAKGKQELTISREQSRISRSQDLANQAKGKEVTISREQPRISDSQDLANQAKGKEVTISREQSRISHSQDLAHQAKGNLDNKQEVTISRQPPRISLSQDLALEVKGNLDNKHEETISRKSLLKFISDYEPPDIPSVPGLHGLIGKCSKPIEKQLTASDVNENNSKLFMDKADVEGCLLPLLNEDEDLKKGINVTVYDQEGNEFDMVFKMWIFKIYVLDGGWLTFLKKYKLIQHQDFLTIWMFRKLDNGKLCFVIHSRRLPVFIHLRENISWNRTVRF